METAKRYRDAAVTNAGIFINDKADSVTRLIDGLKIKLEKQYKLKANNVDALTNDIAHELKQLELRGALTQEKVKQALDQYQHKALKQKYVTAAQWKEIADDVQGSFASPTWYQRVFGGGPAHSKLFEEDSFHIWLSTSVTQRLQENKELTKDEINTVVETLREAVSRVSASAQDLSKLATSSWWSQLIKDLEKQGKLKQAQAERVAESLKDEVNAYKIFAMDYAGEKKLQSQNLLAATSQYIKDTGNNIYQVVLHSLKSNPKREAEVNSAVYTASSAIDVAASTASILRSEASQSIYEAKDNFGRFWRQKELEIYKKVGYTEAHIEWIENYLAKTFHDRKDLAKETVHQAIRTIRQYLIQAKVQTAAHIDAQLKSIEGLIESWRRTFIRDEL